MNEFIDYVENHLDDIPKDDRDTFMKLAKEIDDFEDQFED